MPSRSPRYRYFTFAAVCPPERIYDIAASSLYCEWDYAPDQLMSFGYIQFFHPMATPSWPGVQAVFAPSSLSYMTIDHVPKLFVLGVPVKSVKPVRITKPITKSQGHVFGPKFDDILASSIQPTTPPPVCHKRDSAFPYLASLFNSPSVIINSVDDEDDSPSLKPFSITVAGTIISKFTINILLLPEEQHLQAVKDLDFGKRTLFDTESKICLDNYQQYIVALIEANKNSCL